MSSFTACCVRNVYSIIFVVIGDLNIISEKLIGNGFFGSVFEGRWKQMPCAVKVLNALGQEILTGLPVTKGKIQEEALVRFKKECDFMKDLQHQNVVAYFDTLFFPKCNLPVLVMELMDISLRNYIDQNQLDLTMKTQVSVSYDIAAALAFLHEKNIVHRDLCGDNVLLHVNCGGAIPVAKVSDFGMSHVIIKYAKLTHSLTVMGQRPGFMPPEAPQDPANYDSSLDIFMFGATMTMIANKSSDITDEDHRKQLFDRLDDHHPLRSIIRECLSEKKESRPKTKTVHSVLLKVKGNTLASYFTVQACTIINTLSLHLCFT